MLDLVYFRESRLVFSCVSFLKNMIHRLQSLWQHFGKVILSILYFYWSKLTKNHAFSWKKVPRKFPEFPRWVGALWSSNLIIFRPGQRFELTEYAHKWKLILKWLYQCGEYRFSKRKCFPVSENRFWKRIGKDAGNLFWELYCCLWNKIIFYFEKHVSERMWASMEPGNFRGT